MAKKIPVLNSPWGRSFERPSDCERWVRQGHAFMTPEGLSFTNAFLKSVQRQAVEADPTGTDDGVARRWAYVESGSLQPGAVAVDGQLFERRIGKRLVGALIVESPGGLPVQQLLPVTEVGTGSFVTRNPDKLRRRQYRLTRLIEPCTTSS